MSRAIIPLVEGKGEVESVPVLPRRILLLDADDDCPAELGPSLNRRGRAATRLPAEVVLATREFEAWFPGHGWVGIDPSNDHLIDERYIRVAYGRDYADVTPIKGSYRGTGSSSLCVDVTVSVGGQQQ